MDLMELKNVGLEVQFHNPLGVMTLDDFSYTYKDKELKRIAGKASLYLILQRPCVVFRKLKINSNEIIGEIYQPFTNKYLKFFLPLFQNDVLEGEERDLSFQFAFNKSLPSPKNQKNIGSFENVELIIIKETEQNGGQFRKFITPDVLLERWYKDLWKLIIQGEHSSFLNFEVLYIGHSVKQFIADRIKEHSNIQRILTRRSPMQFGMHISKELCICLLQIADIWDSRNLSKLPKEEIKNYLMNKETPNDESIYYDAEKAFINFFNRGQLENEDKYPNYPISKNGLFEKSYPIIMYSIQDEINLVANDRELKCGRKTFDSIVVNRNEKTIEKIGLPKN